MGIVGGFLGELLKFYRVRDEFHRTGWPRYAKNLPYWIITGLMILAGGLFVYAYESSGQQVNAILALNIGATAPLILRSMFGTAESGVKKPPVD